jgi:hypothetical protein
MLSVEENKPNFDLDHIDLDINHPAIRIQGALDNVLIYNLHDFIVCFLENLELNATSHTYKFDVFNLTFKNVRVEGEYNITGDLGDIFDLFGDGNFWYTFKINLILLIQSRLVQGRIEKFFDRDDRFYLRCG